MNPLDVLAWVGVSFVAVVLLGLACIIINAIWVNVRHKNNERKVDL